MICPEDVTLPVAAGGEPRRPEVAVLSTLERKPVGQQCDMGSCEAANHEKQHRVEGRKFGGELVQMAADRR